MQMFRKTLVYGLIAVLMVTGMVIPQAVADTGSHGTGSTLVAANGLVVASSYYRNLYQGCRGDDVRTLQRRLKELGYYTGAIDGIFGNNNKNAVKNFQRRNNLAADGIAGSKTFAALNSSNAVPASSSGSGSGSGTGSTTPYYNGRNYLQRGDSGEQVLSMQYRLNALGYYKGAYSGYFDNAVYDAVIAFQRINRLGVDGLAGRTTMGVMYSNSAIPAPGGSLPTQTPTPSGSWRVLKYGMSGQDVTDAQTMLRKLGYYFGATDGLFGSAMMSAVSSFQARNWLTVNGTIDLNTYNQLYSNSAVPAPDSPGQTATPSPVPGGVPTYRLLKKGMSGTDVEYAQRRLNALGYYNTAYSTYFGDNTDQAVRTFQWRNGLVVDGIMGFATYSALYSSNAVPNGGVTPTPTPTPGPGTATPAPNMPICGIAGHSIYDGKNHNYASCTIKAHFNCDGKEHVLATCNYTGHYKCANTAPQLHETKFTCGHYECYAQVNPGLQHGNAECGTPGHYKCDGKDHKLQGCGHYGCAGGTHTLLGCGHYACAAGTHTQLACGHYACAAGNHAQLACGHYACAAGDHSTLVCGHYACAAGNHTLLGCGHYACAAGNHVPLACGRHYDCLSGSKDYHIADANNQFRCVVENIAPHPGLPK